MIRALVTFGYVGLLRPAPGTWGSAAGVLAGWGLHHLAGFPGLVLGTIAVSLLGFWAVAEAVRDRPDKDPGEIVIDEVAGVWLALCFPAMAFWVHAPDAGLPWPALVASFAFFRLFDIWKPGPAGRADARGDAPGVMLDDLWAGLFAGLAVLATGGLWHWMMG